MRNRAYFLRLLVCLSILVPSLWARNVVVISGGTTATGITGDTFTQFGSVSTGTTGAFLTLSNPAGSKYYIISNSSTNTVVVANSSLTSVTPRLNVSGGATDAVMTPDGTRLLVLSPAGALYIIETTTDTSFPPVSLGSSASSLAVAHDSSRAFVLSPAAQRLWAVDISTRAVTSGTVSSTATALTVGPNGLVYVSSQNLIQEIDGRSLGVLRSFPVSGLPGMLSFTSDGRRAMAVNRAPTIAGSLISVDVLSGTASVTGAIGGVLLDKVTIVSPIRAIALSSQAPRLLYDVVNIFTGSVVQGAFGLTGVQGMAASDEVSQARYLYATAGSTVHRILIENNQSVASGQIPLPSAGGAVSFAGPASTASAVSSIKFNDSQTVNLLAQSLPLVVRAVDASGRPAYGRPVSFTATAGAVVVSSMFSTNAQGFAQAIVQAPAIATAFQVIVTGAGISATFNLVAVSGGGVPGGTGVGRVSGNGQIVRESSVSRPIEVIVRDSQGNPLPNQTVTWTISGQGTLSKTTDTTNSSGMSTNFFFAPFLSFLGSTFPFVQSTILASATSGSVQFTITTIPLLVQVGGGAPVSVPDPVVEILTPTGSTGLTGRSGDTLPAGIQTRVTTAFVPVPGFSGVLIPNVGVTIATGVDATVGPTASCEPNPSGGGEQLTSSSGIATCNVILGGRPGTAQITVTAGGGIQAFRKVDLEITGGLPEVLRILQGDGQSGRPGTRLPQQLIAEVLDSFGNQIPGVDVTWSVISGNATLEATVSRSDFRGRVATSVRLGSTPGEVKIRVAVEEAEAVFTATAVVEAAEIQKISGDNQSAVVNSAFASPLVVQLLNAQAQPVVGAPVSFAVTSGSATVSSPVITGSDGRASASVQAGGTAGPVVITATVDGLSVTFNLTVNPPGPLVSISAVLNGASFMPGIAPCGIAAITGNGFAQGIDGYALANQLFGPLPMELAGVSVKIGGWPAPIYQVANVGGRQSVTVQVPCELPGQVITSVLVGSNLGTAVRENVELLSEAPGILEFVGESGTLLGVVARPDGSFVSQSNPAQRGEIVRMYVTGLGRADPAIATNQVGTGGQKVRATVVVGVNNAGVRVVSAEYAENMVGIYVVDFEIPADTAAGPQRPLAVAVVGPDGDLIFGQGSAIPIQ